MFVEAQIHLATAACGNDPSPIYQATRLAKSLVVSSSPLHHKVFHVFTDNSKTFLEVFAQAQRSLQSSLESSHTEIEVHQVPQNHPRVNLFRKCTILKLDLHALLPTLDSVVWVDADTLFFEDSARLWRLFRLFDSFQCIGAAQERVVPNTGWYSTGPGQGTPYFDFSWPTGLNSGVLLMNLTRLRASLFGEAVQKIEASRPHHMLFPDQDILNIYLNATPQALYTLPCRWNLRADTRADCPTKLARAGIVHGNGGTFRPKEMMASYASYIDALQPAIPVWSCCNKPGCNGWCAQ